MCRVVVLLIKPIVFFTFSLLSVSLALKVSIVRLAIFTLETDYPSETDNPSSKPVKIDGKQME